MNILFFIGITLAIVGTAIVAFIITVHFFTLCNDVEAIRKYIEKQESNPGGMGWPEDDPPLKKI